MAAGSQQVEDLAARCLQSLLAGWDDWTEPADRLAALATSEASDDAARAVFTGIVEPLADRFEPRLVLAYRRFFARLLTRCDWLLPELDQLGLPDDSALLDRAARIADTAPAPLAPQAVRRVIIPSRVTVGADVALTLRAVGRVLHCCPDAQVEFWGGRSSASLLPTDPRVRSRVWDYPRRGGLRARLDAWSRMRESVASLWDESTWLIDLDTRWSQAGMLPLTPNDDRLLFWESRSYRPESSAPLSQLVDEWLDEVVGASSQKPAVAHPRADLSEVKRPVAVVNFGVGGNEAKRLGDGFEKAVLETLGAAGYSVLLDQGFGEEERRRTRELASGGLARLRQTTISELAGLIAAADLYVGYDSAGGHIAAALGTRAVDLFAGAVSPRMIDRWSPWGVCPADVIAVSDEESPDAVLARLRERLV